ARHLRRARGADDRRRGHHRVRPDRALVRLRARPRRPRPHDGRQGHHVRVHPALDRKSTRLNSSHVSISYAVFCLKKKKNINYRLTNENRTRTNTKTTNLAEKTIGGRRKNQHRVLPRRSSSLHISTPITHIPNSIH